MPSEPYWLPAEQVIEINRDAVAVTGEPHLLTHADLLESALANPRNKYVYDGETDVVALAVALLFALCRNHPFEQGNKRTGLTAAIMFLAVNGYELTVPDHEDLARAIISVIERRTAEDDFTEMLAGHVREISET